MRDEILLANNYIERLSAAETHEARQKLSPQLATSAIRFLEQTGLTVDDELQPLVDRLQDLIADYCGWAAESTDAPVGALEVARRFLKGDLRFHTSTTQVTQALSSDRAKIANANRPDYDPNDPYFLDATLHGTAADLGTPEPGGQDPS